MFELEDSMQSPESHLNFERMYKYLGDDKESIKEILLMVLEELKLSVQKFEDYIFNECLAEIKTMAHKLVGTTASVGLEKLCATARKIEQLNYFDSEALQALLSKFKYEANLVKKLINSYLINS